MFKLAYLPTQDLYYDANFKIEMAGTILAAFPKLTQPFINFLFAYFEKLKYSPYRIVKSVEYVIENGYYPEPTFAEFIKPYNFQFTGYTYNDLYNSLWSRYKQDWASYMNDFVALQLNDSSYYFSQTDYVNIAMFLSNKTLSKLKGGKC